MTLAVGVISHLPSIWKLAKNKLLSDRCRSKEERSNLLTVVDEEVAADGVGARRRSHIEDRPRAFNSDGAAVVPSHLDSRRGGRQDGSGSEFTNLGEDAVDVENGLKAGPVTKLHNGFVRVVSPGVSFAVGREGDVSTQTSPRDTTGPGLKLEDLEASVGSDDNTTRATGGVEGLRVERESDQRANLELGGGSQHAIGYLEVHGGPEEETTLVDGERAVSFNTKSEAGFAGIISAVVHVETGPNNVPASKHGNVGVERATVPTSHVIHSLVGVVERRSTEAPET